MVCWFPDRNIWQKGMAERSSSVQVRSRAAGQCLRESDEEPDTDTKVTLPSLPRNNQKCGPPTPQTDPSSN